MIKITSALVEDVLKKAASSPRKRANYNFHKTYDAPIQRMLNAANPGTVLYEVKDGPYNKEVDKNFAPWAPRRDRSSPGLQ